MCEIEKANSSRKKPRGVHFDNQLSTVKTAEEAQKLLDHIATTIHNAGTLDKEIPINQMVLNVSFRNYYAVLELFNLPDKHFARLTDQLHSKSDFLMLNAVLLTSHNRQLDTEQLGRSCQAALTKAINENSNSILAIVKSLNFVYRRDPALNLDISLEDVYYLLQRQIPGLREETLALYCSTVKDAQRAEKHFGSIIEFWPWTNKNKYYLLSCILHVHSLNSEVLRIKNGGSIFQGVRLALNYKRLFAASQYLIKALSYQESEELLQLSAEVLTQGSRQEITNFFSQWFSRIVQKDTLFLLLQQQLDIANALCRFNTFENDSTHHYRFILIFSMFSRQVFQLSKLHFFKISTEVITRCFDLEVESQLLVFKFVVDNLSNFAIEDCLDFILRFVRTHRGIDSAQLRSSILGKLPTIFNYISKTFNRIGPEDTSTLTQSIKNFFIALHEIIESDIHQRLYQPKIFALRLLDILVKTFYSLSPAKNAKNCNIVQNQSLGLFLMTKENIFNVVQIRSKLLVLLHDPQGFDDALELLVGLLKELRYSEAEEITEICQAVVQSCDLDECGLSSIYAQVAINSFSASKSLAATKQLFHYCFKAVKDALGAFEADPLLACKSRNHLFGFLEIMNLCVGAEVALLQPHLKALLDLVENIVIKILKMLNLSTTDEEEKHSALRDIAELASFQDMDESLEILVQESVFTPDNSEDCRKFLMISFWLTLKACCEVASTIGCHLVNFNELDAQHVQCVNQCLKINTLVLTKCRHKGAIEAAGVTIGKLTKCLSVQLNTNSKIYQLLYNCIDFILHEREHQISTTRRGAGFSIMFLHLIKNEQKTSHPLLHRAMRTIFARLDDFTNKIVKQNRASAKNTADNYDCFESLSLHYLCVLVKDTELREVMIKYYDDIMMAAIKKIDNPEWTICNAALQLFGALVPKIVGQKQATDFETSIAWEPTEVTFMEIAVGLPKTCKYILNYCDLSITERENRYNGARVRSIILFLSFLSQVEHLRKNAENADSCAVMHLQRFRELMWSLLGHRVEKVRKLAATCFVRAHGFRCDLPLILLEITDILFAVRGDNLFQGLTYVLIEGIRKFLNESMFTMEKFSIDILLGQLKLNLSQNFHIKRRNLYSLCKLLELMSLLGFNENSDMVSELIDSSRSQNSIGNDVFQSIVSEIGFGLKQVLT